MTRTKRKRLEMLDSRDRGRDSDEDEVKSKVRKRMKATTTADRRCARKSSSDKAQGEAPEVLRKRYDQRRCKAAVRMKKLVNAMTVVIWDAVEIESGHWCMILVNESHNHNGMIEKAGPVLAQS